MEISYTIHRNIKTLQLDKYFLMGIKTILLNITFRPEQVEILEFIGYPKHHRYTPVTSAMLGI